MTEIDSRRVTGANFFCDEPAVVIDVSFPDSGQEELIKRWSLAVAELHTMLGRPAPALISHRIHGRGQTLFFTAPIDALYTSIDLAEVALKIASDSNFHAASEETSRLVSGFVAVLQAAFEEEANPGLLALQAKAAGHKVPFLWDDDYVSLGYGKSRGLWAIDDLPETGPDTNLDWQQFDTIPLAFITGTNGKSTTTRLAAQILGGAGKTVGFSSTDGIWAGDECLDRGDYSGPGGAREVLRNPKVDAAILEVARGGLLRRGLGAAEADAALITNVAEDHLGEYGINTLDELIAAKFVVRKSLGADGKLILNADDPGIVAYTRSEGAVAGHEIIWFSLDCNNAQIRAARDGGSTVYFADKGILFSQSGDTRTKICHIADIPICLNGYATHNIYNALAASALTHTLGVAIDQVSIGLQNFVGDKNNNPGRGNMYFVHGATMMVDFAHNPHGLNAVVDTLLKFPAKRRLVMLGHAGDRSNADIQKLTEVAARLNPDLVIIYELEEYLRGRAIGEIPALIADVMIRLGLDKEQIVLTTDPVAAVKHAVAWAGEGDVLLLQTLGDRDKVIAVLESSAKEMG